MNTQRLDKRVDFRGWDEDGNEIFKVYVPDIRRFPSSVRGIEYVLARHRGDDFTLIAIDHKTSGLGLWENHNRPWHGKLRAPYWRPSAPFLKLTDVVPLWPLFDAVLATSRVRWTLPAATLRKSEKAQSVLAALVAIYDQFAGNS